MAGRIGSAFGSLFATSVIVELLGLISQTMQTAQGCEDEGGGGKWRLPGIVQ